MHAKGENTLSLFQRSQHWTPQQALAVYECLEQLLQIIWEQHEAELGHLFAATYLSPTESLESIGEYGFDDSIPF